MYAISHCIAFIGRIKIVQYNTLAAQGEKPSIYAYGAANGGAVDLRHPFLSLRCRTIGKGVVRLDSMVWDVLLFALHVLQYA